MEPRFAGHVALVTGAARQSGIGRAIALRLAAEGASVVVTGLERSPSTFPESERTSGWKGLASVVEEVVGTGGRAIGVEGDVGDADAARAMVDAAVDTFGRLDVVVNNAATARWGPTLIELEDEEWQRVLHTNLTGTYFVSKAAAKAIIAAGRGGAIVNISSTAGRAAQAGMGAYSPAKFGIIGLTQGMALELAQFGIRVNCVAPGATETEMEAAVFRQISEKTGASYERTIEARIKQIPLGRMAFPEEMASAVAYLASADASYVTGQTINVTGGPPFN